MPGGYQPPYPANHGQPYGQPYGAPYAPNPGGYQARPPYGTPTPAGPPSGATAVVASLLAMGLGVLAAVAAINAFDAADHLHRLVDGSAASSLRIIGGVNAVLGALWFLGGLLLLSRKNGGRVLVIALACLGGLGNAASAIVGFSSGVPAAGTVGLVGLGVAAVVLGLTLAPSTGRWLAAVPWNFGQYRYGRAPSGLPAQFGQPPYGQPAPPTYPYGQSAPPQGQQYPPYH